MKGLLTILFTVVLCESFATTRYVSTTGDDIVGTGTFAKPYKTLKKAASLSVSGDIIHVNAGLYNETQQSIVAAGVSIEGEGAYAGGTHINLNWVAPTGFNIFNTAVVMLTSGAMGTNGNQSIQNIWFDGNNFTSYVGVLVRCRSNVIIDHCVFTNFKVGGVNLNGKLTNNTGIPPATFSIGNQITHCKFIDCNDRTIQQTNSVSMGSISYSGQANLLFQYDTTYNSTNPLGKTHNGDCYAGIQGNSYSVRWLDCVSRKPADEGAGFNFHIENWYDQGNCEIARCYFEGGGNTIDIGYGSANKGVFASSWHIHDNTFTNSAPLVGGGHPVESIAVQFETSTNTSLNPLPPHNTFDGDAEVDHNYLYNMGECVKIALGNNPIDYVKNINIHHNVCSNMGYSNNFGAFVFEFDITNGTLIDNITIDNNTIVGNTSGTLKGILYLQPTVGTMSNIYFRNNVAMNALTNAYGYMIFRGSGSFTNIYSQNNIIYNNAFTNNPYYFTGLGPITNFVNNNPLKGVNPQFVSLTDFHLGAGSAGINGGLNPPAIYVGAFAPGTIVPTLSWNPASMTFNSAFGAGQLNATSGGVPGIHSYSPALGFVPTAAGTVSVTDVFTPTDQVTYSVVSKTVSITVNPAPETITVTGTTKVFNGTDQEPNISTSPAGLPTSRTYNGVSSPLPNGAGSYSYSVGNASPNYTAATVSGTFTITKGTVVINASSSNVLFDNLQHPVFPTTTPNVPGLVITYDGSSTPSSSVGVHNIHIVLVNNDWQATPVDVTMTIVASSASIFNSNLSQAYTGFPLSITVTTNPPGLAHTTTYNGSPTSPTNKGTYTVVSTITDGVHTGTATDNFVITGVTPTVTWNRPASIPLGTMLSAVQLNAVASVAGTYSYLPPLGAILNVGTQQLSLLFTPTDSNYNSVTKTTLITVIGSSSRWKYFYWNGTIYFVKY